MPTLKELREERYMTQKELAKVLGVSVISIGLWERGLRIPHLRYQKRMVKLFGENAVKNIVWTNDRGKSTD